MQQCHQWAVPSHVLLTAPWTLQGDVVVMQLDLTDLASVKRFARDILARERGPHLLILNAGVMACPQSYTQDGFETQIGVRQRRCCQQPCCSASCQGARACHVPQAC